MAVTKNADLRIGSHGAPSVLTDLSGAIRKVEYPRNLDLFDKTTFNQTGNLKQMEPGFGEAKFNVEGLWSSAIETQLNDLIVNGTEVDYQFGPLATGTGKPKYTGKLVLASFNPTHAIEEQIVFSAEFHVNSATPGTYA